MSIYFPVTHEPERRQKMADRRTPIERRSVLYKNFNRNPPRREAYRRWLDFPENHDRRRLFPENIYKAVACQHGHPDRRWPHYCIRNQDRDERSLTYAHICESAIEINKMFTP